MKDIRKLKTEDKPSSIEYLGDNTYYYNYNITPIKESVLNEETGKTKKVTFYEYVQVLLRGKANYADCVKAIIREYVSVDDEFDLINSANKALLAGETSQEYQDYLNLVSEIKSNVKSDFYASNISI